MNCQDRRRTFGQRCHCDLQNSGNNFEFKSSLTLRGIVILGPGPKITTPPYSEVLVLP